MTRPPLGPIAVGDTVIVTEYRNRTVRKITCTVTKAARVWLDLEETGWPRRYRMRRDTQDTGSPYSPKDYFRTLDQEAWDQRSREANVYLFDEGIEVRSGSTWNTPGRRIQLADLLRTATAVPASGIVHAGTETAHALIQSASEETTR